MTILSRRVLLKVILPLLGVALLAGWWLSRPPSDPLPRPGADQARIRKEVILYFAARAGDHLVAEARELTGCREESCLAETVEALAAGPRHGLTAVLPTSARLLAISEENGVATVDFSRELAAAHPGGSMSELLTVYGLADTLAVNFPYIRQVRILIEGQTVETLKGHVDLRRPVAADFRFARPSAEGADTVPQEEGR
jgi:spore germination protein GerM